MAGEDIYAKLKQDHDKQRDMMKRLAAGENRAKLFEALRLELQSHAAAEEESLYATMLAKPELRDDARHSVSEHKEVDDLLGEMMGVDPASAEWEEKFAKLRHRYEHHIDEEEEEMFPAADEVLSDAKERELAKVYENRKPAELENAKASPPGSDERE
ncbi:hemerythrin domain-containing protein [Sphingomonas sp. ID1715]|uniref:hemerythrin domain-containing protein n=1 Tax=Sphingomonas sp. ID1715 TaxID=1656898 RepID=UPI001489CF86|nr:hemerythrin domain-containing protein [Sphingomonas sp. ID1715]NNM76784.1 hemerythrin domain-containing protein [Sphingomonas sp. ID1715]